MCVFGGMEGIHAFLPGEKDMRTSSFLSTLAEYMYRIVLPGSIQNAQLNLNFR